MLLYQLLTKQAVAKHDNSGITANENGIVEQKSEDFCGKRDLVR
jgi:hypothetical protein